MTRGEIIAWATLGWLFSLLIAGLTGIWWGFDYGREREHTHNEELQSSIRRVEAKAAAGAASAIAEYAGKIQATNTRIERITKEIPVYRDCQHDSRVFDDLNAKLRGSPLNESDTSGMPGESGRASRPGLRIDDK